MMSPFRERNIKQIRQHWLSNPFLLVSLSGLILGLLTLRFQADDWPQFRGPQGWGVSDATGLPLQFGPQRNVVWKVSLPQGHSSPVLTGRRLFLTGSDRGKLFTLCLDSGSGKLLWRQELPRNRTEKFVEGFNTPASPTPVTDGEKIYAFFGDFGLVCYDLAGKECWRLPLGPFNNINGHGSSPVLVDDKLIMLCDQDTNAFLLAVDKKTGKPRWRAERPEVTRGYATPGVLRPKIGPAELVVPGAYELISYSAESGEKLWWISGLSWQAKSVPVITEDMIYVNSWESEGDQAQPRADSLPSFESLLAEHDKNRDGKLSRDELPGVDDEDWEDRDLDKDNTLSAREWEYHRARKLSRNNLLAIRHGGRGDLTDTNVVWRYSKSLPNVPSPLLYRGVLYLVRDGGIATSLDPLTGKVFKQERLKGALEQYYASPVAADGKVFMLSQGGKLSVLKAAANWEVLAVNDMEDECFATPAIADGRLYVRTRTTLYCFRKRDEP
jgi:outer membrane protein assembly factor BamB